jgi:serine/threonine kinase 16
LEIADDASCHTTISYRPPELFMGELRVSNGNDYLDYTKVDVWMLGCTLFALMYGASPFECEFHRTTSNHHHHHHHGSTAASSSSSIKIVDCNQLRVLGNLPKPPTDSAAATWYSQELVQLVEWILHKDRHQRPTLDQVQARVDEMHPPQPQSVVGASSSSLSHHHHHHDVEDPMDLFVHSRNNNVL